MAILPLSWQYGNYTPDGTTPASSQGAAPAQPVNTDFSSKFNDMLAPYQDIAQKFNSPYAFLDKNSSFVGAHPRLAGMLDNGLLSAAMVPGPQGPEGVGGGISRALQGPLGASQFTRNRALQSAMLPYQMLEPRLKAEDTLAQIDLRNQQGQHQIGMDNFYKARVEHYNTMEDQGQQKIDLTEDLNNARIDKLGKDPVSGLRSGAGGFVGQMVAKANPKNAGESDDAYAGRLLNEYVNAQQKIAGGGAAARTRAEQADPHQYAANKDFLDKQFTIAKGALPKPAEDDATWHSKKENLFASIDNKDAYNDYVTSIANKRQQFNNNWSTYHKSGVWQKGVGFDEYIAHPEQYDTYSPSTPQGNAPPSGKVKAPF